MLSKQPVASLLALAALILLSFLIVVTYRSYLLSEQYERVSGLLASSTAIYGSALADLRVKFVAVTGHNADLSTALTTEQTKNDFFQAQINGVKSTVATLAKLSETDKELLQKYSKVYFLNENYIPSDLPAIPSDKLLNPNAALEFHAHALPFLEKMIARAMADGVDLKVLSAYRSFDLQSSLKTSYKMTFGTGANAFSADQGYSEHQLGTAVDLTTSANGDSLTTAFAKLPAYAWLEAHAHQYGFILSYPQGNSYYMYEPWHWRFVGTALAARLHTENKHFYDLDQRTIDAYLALIFD
ncbi:M15 family metallopeptidase [Candidatus Kaiserbacteria bacterium]|nr:M15 family metallopeptidase [Candidatus Kaiserbacteria bacterium]